MPHWELPLRSEQLGQSPQGAQMPPLEALLLGAIQIHHRSGVRACSFSVWLFGHHSCAGGFKEHCVERGHEVPPAAPSPPMLKKQLRVRAQEPPHLSPVLLPPPPTASLCTPLLSPMCVPQSCDTSSCFLRLAKGCLSDIWDSHVAVLPETSPALSRVLRTRHPGLAQGLSLLFRHIVWSWKHNPRRGSPSCLGNSGKAFWRRKQLSSQWTGTEQVEGRGARTQWRGGVCQTQRQDPAEEEK